MKKFCVALEIVIVACLSFSVSCRADERGDKIIANLQKKYRSVKDAVISFTQDVTFGATKTEQSFRGKFYMKRSNNYRIEMEDHTIVTDGKSVWRYTELNNQVLIDNYREDPRGFSPENLLVDIPSQYSPIVLGVDEISEKENIILKLTPKDEKSTIKYMKLWVEEKENIVRKIEVRDLSENIIVYNIDTVLFNTGLASDMFIFKTPDGASVIDLR